MSRLFYSFFYTYIKLLKPILCLKFQEEVLNARTLIFLIILISNKESKMNHSSSVPAGFSENQISLKKKSISETPMRERPPNILIQKLIFSIHHNYFFPSNKTFVTKFQVLSQRGFPTTKYHERKNLYRKPRFKKDGTLKPCFKFYLIRVFFFTN